MSVVHIVCLVFLTLALVEMVIGIGIILNDEIRERRRRQRQRRR